MLKLELVLPCYNEEKNLPLIVRRAIDAATEAGFDQNTFKLILVENGSSDQSSAVMDELLKSSGAWFRKVQIVKNEGYGNGIWTGLKTTTAPIVAWSHADMQCDPANVFRAYKECTNAKIFVKGERSGRSPRDIFVSRVFEFLALVILGLRCREMNAQPKLFHRELLNQIKDPPKTFAFDMYVLYQAAKDGYQLKTIDVLFPPRIHGVSKWAAHFFGRYKTILGIIRYMFELKGAEGRLRG